MGSEDCDICGDRHGSLYRCKPKEKKPKPHPASVTREELAYEIDLVLAARLRAEDIYNVVDRLLSKFIITKRGEG
jgi:hypothetical protein